MNGMELLQEEVWDANEKIEKQKEEIEGLKREIKRLKKRVNYWHAQYVDVRP